MKVYIANIVHDSIVDGEGLRTTIFFQGCPHHCEGCHNPQTWNMEDVQPCDVFDVIREIDDIAGSTDGITFSGGEPFLQHEALTLLAWHAHNRGLSVWVYTGYTYEQIIEKFGEAVLQDIDVLVDGRFVLAEKSLDLPWRGSRNQRVIDVKSKLNLQ